MSYIYKIDGSVIKTEKLIEHFNICLGGVCISDEQKKDEACPSAPAPIVQYSHIKECPTCTSCDTMQCPVTKPCPVCDDKIILPEDMLDSNITEPFIIKEQINTANIIYLAKEYLEKLNRFNVSFIKKYILYSNSEDIKRLMEIYNFLDLDLVYDIEKSTESLIINLDNMNVINTGLDSVINGYDIQKLIPEDIKRYFDENKFIDPPKNVEKIKSYFAINVSFKPKNKAIKTYNNLETFYDSFNVEGNFNLEFYDLQINEVDYRYLSIVLTQQQKQLIYNALEFHIPFEVSLDNNNLPPDYLKKNKILIMAKNYLQKLFTKPDIYSYIYFEKEYSKSLIDILRSNIDNIEYNEQETNILVSEINDNQEYEIKKFNNLINPDIYGNILELKKAFKFTFHNIVYKSSPTHNILLEEIKDSRFLLTFNENWVGISDDIKLDDILLIKKGDNDSAYAINEKYYDYWRVVNIYNSTYTLENMEYFDIRKDIDVELDYTYFDMDGKLPMPNNLTKAKEILQIYNFDDYQMQSIMKFGKTVSELTLSSSTRIEMSNPTGEEYDENNIYTSGRNLMEVINKIAVNISSTDNRDISKNLCANLLNILENSDIKYAPVSVLCDNDPNIIIIKFYLFYIYDLKMTNYKTYRFLRI